MEEEFSQHEIKEFDKKVKREGKNKSVSFRFCPACSSINLKPLIYGLGKDSAALSPQMRCTDCNFYGFVFEGSPEFIKEFREELEKKKISGSRV